MSLRTFATEAEERAYQLGVADGNAAATRSLIGCVHPLRVVIDPSMPEGVCEIRARDAKCFRVPHTHLQLLTGRRDGI